MKTEIVSVGGKLFNIWYKTLQDREHVINDLNQTNQRFRSLSATCPVSSKNVGDTVLMNLTPANGTPPYTVNFYKGTTLLNSIPNVLENQQVSHIYTIPSTDANSSHIFKTITTDSCSGSTQSIEQCTVVVNPLQTQASLVGHWRFNEGVGTVAYDSSTYGNNATIYGATWTTGKIGSALQFNGINNYVDARNPPSLQITGAITLIGWIKLNNLAVSSGLFGRGHGLGSPGDFGYFVTYYATTASIYFDTHSTIARDTLHLTNAIIDTNWHHIAVTWNGTTSVNGKKLYIDGVLSAQSTSTISTMGIPTYNFTIGRDSNGDRPANAIIDEVKVYNRALSDAEILSDYNLACPQVTANLQIT